MGKGSGADGHYRSYAEWRQRNGVRRHEGWIASPNNPVLLLPLAPGAESDGARLDAQLFFPAEIKQALTRWRSGFPQTSVGDKDVQVISGSAPGGTRVKLFFDMKSGLLVRQLRYSSTIVGTNPYQIDYADYRDVNGQKLPYQWTVTWTNGQSTWRVQQIQADLAIPDRKIRQTGSRRAGACQAGAIGRMS